MGESFFKDEWMDGGHDGEREMNLFVCSFSYTTGQTSLKHFGDNQ